MTSCTWSETCRTAKIGKAPTPVAKPGSQTAERTEQDR
jgi:hypothetical protein